MKLSAPLAIRAFLISVSSYVQPASASSRPDKPFFCKEVAGEVYLFDTAVVDV